MTRASIAGIDLKLGRADECLTFLDRERNALLKAKGDRVVGDFDAKAGDYVFRVPGDGPPLAWGIIVGEFAHALRSALDNLLWQLIMARGGTPSTGRDGIRKIGNQFPIYEEEADFIRKTHGSTMGEMQTWGVLADDFTFIKDQQPYHLGRYLAGWHPLAMLAYLNNVDKHRYVHAAFAAMSSTVLDEEVESRPFFTGQMGSTFLRLGIHVPTYPADPKTVHVAGGGHPRPVPQDSVVMPEFISVDYGGSDDDPAEVARVFNVRPRWPGAKMEMKPRLVLDISLSDRERPMSIIDFQEIRTAVEEIVDRFRPFIP